MRKERWRRALALAAMLLAPTAASAEDASTSLQELLAEYRCPVVDRCIPVS